MAKSQPKIDDIKDLKRATDASDGLMSSDDKDKLDNLSYGDLEGDMPVATNVKIGGFKTGHDGSLTNTPEALDVRVGNTPGDYNEGRAFVIVGAREVKTALGLEGFSFYNSQDIFISGMPTPYDNFNSILHIGSYRVDGAYDNAPNRNCGTNTTARTSSMVGTLNVFRSGFNNWETIQQLFWVLNGKTEQYQRSYSGEGGAWTVWKRLIKCDDYADLNTGREGIISEANLEELFRAPDLIQLWNAEDLGLTGGTYYLDSLTPIDVPIENTIRLDANNIVDLKSERRYRVTYEVHCVRVSGKGEVTIEIENGGTLYSASDFIFEYEVGRRIAFSVILTNIDFLTPIIKVEPELEILIYRHYYQISVEEIKFPSFTPVPFN